MQTLFTKCVMIANGVTMDKGRYLTHIQSRLTLPEMEIINLQKKEVPVIFCRESAECHPVQHGTTDFELKFLLETFELLFFF